MDGKCWSGWSLLSIGMMVVLISTRTIAVQLLFAAADIDGYTIVTVATNNVGLRD